MVAASTRKKQLIWLAPILLILVVMGANIHLENQRAYKKISFADTDLFVPKALLPRSEPDLINMVRDHLSHTVTNRLQLVQYADDLLPRATAINDTVGDTSIIWTIEPQEEHTRPILPDLTLDGATGLYKAATSSDAAAFVYADNNAAPSWHANCIEFRILRPGDSWGRCSYEYLVDGLLVRLHYDGRLITETGTIATASEALLKSWLKEPD